ncbi:MAG: hypothetical protein ACI8VT_000034, partial [Saprospiraceae bacterium]
FEPHSPATWLKRAEVQVQKGVFAAQRMKFKLTLNTFLN